MSDCGYAGPPEGCVTPGCDAHGNYEAPADLSWQPDVDRVYVVISDAGGGLIGVKRARKQREGHPEYVETMHLDHAVALLNALTKRVAFMEAVQQKGKERWWRRSR